MPHWAEQTMLVPPPDLEALDLEAMPPLVREMARLALLDVAAGVVEFPRGSNRGGRVDAILRGREGNDALLCFDRYNTPDDQPNRCKLCGGKPAPTDDCRGCPWCGRYAVHLVRSAALTLQVACPIDGWGGLASAKKWRREARKRGLWSEVPVYGVGVLLDDDSDAGHVAAVTLSISPAGVLTVDGNLRQQVGCALRPASVFAGFVPLQ